MKIHIPNVKYGTFSHDGLDDVHIWVTLKPGDWGYDEKGFWVNANEDQ